MNYDRTQRIRRAAILVAHLEESLAEQMLESLPRLEAVTILNEVDRLGELDQEEVEDVLDEFRTAGRRGRPGEDAVEFTYSAPRAEAAASAAMATAMEEAAVAAANAQSEADAVLMAELLTHEHPQTIAAALSRLGHERGAAVFAALPAGLQAEVLDRLANLEPADESVVMELESQLQQRVEQHRQRKDRASAAKEMARQILGKTAPGQREVLMARLSSPTPQSGGVNRLESGARTGREGSQQAQVLASAVQLARRGAATEAYAETGGFEVWADESAVESSKPPATADLRQAAGLEDRSRELESLDDRSLLEALRVADERTVQCALAASSERFFKRVAGKLPRQQASRLRQVVRSIGPTRLTELREAQHELLRIARGGQAVGVASR
jgi:flagellar motor switch protein FliG